MAGVWDRAKTAWGVLRGKPMAAPVVQRGVQTQSRLYFKAHDMIADNWFGDDDNIERGGSLADDPIEKGYNINAVIYAAIMYKVRASYTAPLRAYGGDVNNPVLLQPEHPLAMLLESPNPEMSWSFFHGLNTIFYSVLGEFYAYKVRKGRTALPEKLLPLNPANVETVMSKDTGEFVGYLYKPPSESRQKPFPILPEDMITLRMPNPNDPTPQGRGYSPLLAAAKPADVDAMLTTFLHNYFKKGGVPPGYIKVEIALEEDEADMAERRWQDKMGGSDNWHRTPVMDNGTEYKGIGSPLKDMEFGKVDTRNETRVLATLGVSSILLDLPSGLENSTYANKEEANRAFWENTFLPEMMLVEEAYRRHLRTEDGGFVAFDTSKVPALRDDIAAQTEAWSKLVDRGVPPDVAARMVGMKLESYDGSDKPYQKPQPTISLPGGDAPKKPDQEMPGTAPADDDGEDGVKKKSIYHRSALSR